MEIRGKWPFRFRLVRHRTSTRVKVAAMLAIVLSTAVLFTLCLVRNRNLEQTRALQAQAAALEAENARLEENIGELGTERSIVRIAGEEMGLVTPGTVFFQP